MCLRMSSKSLEDPTFDHGQPVAYFLPIRNSLSSRQSFKVSSGAHLAIHGFKTRHNILDEDCRRKAPNASA